LASHPGKEGMSRMGTPVLTNNAEMGRLKKIVKFPKTINFSEYYVKILEESIDYHH
jgi:hypothetical protein